MPTSFSSSTWRGAGRDTLLIAPTGGGKTLAGFLPSLVDLARAGAKPQAGIHTLYVSPLKALAVDIARNLTEPVAEMGLPITLETRTGDTPPSRRQRQRLSPPNILLTTPEQIALMLSHRDAASLFGSLRMVIIDELHAMASTKRGDLLALDLARLRTHAPDLTAIGLSATVARPSELAAFLVGHEGQARTVLAEIVQAGEGPKADIAILNSEAELPWAGHSARYALPEIYEAIKAHRMSLIFVNTRSQAEMLFHALWRYNDENLPIALHHGSLDVGQRRKVEAAMVAGKLRAVVCTSTLDLGIDWGDVDLVINVGAPKGASRLAQRIGRANHRLDEPSKALLVPANRFEVVECQAALEAAEEGAQDTPPSRPGALDVLAQHVLGMACSGPFDPDQLYREVTSASPYQGLTREGFDKIVRFVSTGGYALANYERYAKLKEMPDGRYRIAHPRLAQQYRLNVGTIVEAPMVRVRLARLKGGALKPSSMLAAGRVLGEVEEYFIEQLMPGDSFAFAGEVLRFEGMRETDAIVTRSHAPEPKVPSYDGGKFPLSTYLADRVRHGCSPTGAIGRGFLIRCRTGCAFKARCRSCPAPMRSWSRPFHAGNGIISSVIPSKDGSLIKASACCSPGGSNAHMPSRSASSPTNMLSACGVSPIWARWCATDGLTSPNCSTRTCSATISTPGLPSRA